MSTLDAALFNTPLPTAHVSGPADSVHYLHLWSPYSREQWFHYLPEVLLLLIKSLVYAGYIQTREIIESEIYLSVGKKLSSYMYIT